MSTIRRRTSVAAAAFALALVVAVALAACGGDTTTETETAGGTETLVETEADTVTETVVEEERSSPDTVAPTQECENPTGGYTVGYPDGWYANLGEVSERCSFFHPEPFELPEQTEAPDVAVAISREPVPFARVTGAGPAIRILDREETEIDGRRAVRRETEATGDALRPAGVRGYEYLVDLGGETLILSTYEGSGLDYERNRETVDRMAATLRID